MRRNLKARGYSVDGKQRRKTKEEIQEEMLVLKEGQDDEEVRKNIKTLKEEVLRRPTPEELEQDKLEHEEKRKRLLELFKPKT